jgi:hypothetical protein
MRVNLQVHPSVAHQKIQCYPLNTLPSSNVRQLIIYTAPFLVIGTKSIVIGLYIPL